MEKKKLLFVAVSVGIFLVIVIGAAIIILSKQDANPSVIARESSTPVMSGTLVPYTPTASVAEEEPSVANISESSTNTGITNPPDNSGITIVTALPEERAPDSINHFYGNTNTNSDVRIETYTPAGLAKAAETPKTTSPVSRPAATAVSPAPARTQTTRTPAAAVQAPKPPAPARVYNDYWVQTGSFSAKVRADNVKENLGMKGINSVIEVRNVNNKTMYRVRVGPYTSQNEAEYWLSLIQSIDGFEESQIWQSQSVH